MNDDLTYIKFEVPGKPVQWQRRVVTKRGFSFMPKLVTSYKSMIVTAYLTALGCFRRTHVPHPGPVKMEVESFWPIPKSRPKWWKAIAQEERVPMISTPDQDNMLKIVGDALNQVAFVDDRLIYDSRVTMFYSQRPRLVVSLCFLTILENPKKKPTGA